MPKRLSSRSIMNTHTQLRLNETTFWQACLDKDARYDGKFVLAVVTTGIYCRPACPARKPKRENVMFFALPELAQQAGFRACKRCHPDNHMHHDPQLDLVRELCRYIEANSAEPMTLQVLSDRFHASTSHLQRTFKDYVGISPQEYTEACRMNELRRVLRDGARVSDAVYEAGFGSSSRVYEKAAPQLGMTPQKYQRNGTGEIIQYAVVPCAMGKLLVATTAKGICAVKLGDDADALINSLLGEFTDANVVRNDDAHKEWVQAILNFVAGHEPHLDLPLDVRATAFQKKCGRPCARCRMAKHAAMPISRTQSTNHLLCVRWHKRVAQTPPRSSCRAIASCGRMGRWEVITGASDARCNC